MNNTQRILLAVYLPITLLILIFDNLYPEENMVIYLRYTIIITLFLSVVIIQKNYHEQKVMALSFFFIIIADFFLVFSESLDSLKMDVSPFGIAGFLFAYLCLIVAYQKNAKIKIGNKEVISAIPIILIFIFIFITLQPYVKLPMLIGTLIFGIVLCYMTWAAVCTIFRRYYSPKISRLIALSGSLMFVCDMGVAFQLFHPYYSVVYVSWLKNIIWAAYIPGWTLLAMVISEENLY